MGKEKEKKEEEKEEEEETHREMRMGEYNTLGEIQVNWYIRHEFESGWRCRKQRQEVVYHCTGPSC